MSDQKIISIRYWPRPEKIYDGSGPCEFGTWTPPEPYMPRIIEPKPPLKAPSSSNADVVDFLHVWTLRHRNPA